VQLDDVGVRFDLPMEPIASLKEYAIRRLQRRIQFREVWALRNVQVTVPQGAAIGVVGRNGAGKSTLLRVLGRVLRPTYGRVRVRGAVAALIEVGAGFHPELSGRENVFLNGTLLGRSTSEVRRQFDDIVDFAEIGKFIDAPIRTYSTGMTLRLGFAVATAWNADVLLVDEVLAVGDESFRRKCARRIEQLRERNGTTIVLVSHDLAMIRSICGRTLWLDGGRVRMDGSANEVTAAYHAKSDEQQTFALPSET
jgi:ABC-type polysaccharide/polyol phosphate transport system ATPase subunit